MRHAKKVNHLGRKSEHRKAMLSNMAASLILHKRIQTTVAKAKALKKYVEPLLTRAKEDTTHNRRTVFNYLGDKKPVIELFSTVSDKISNRPGGYTRIIKLGNRAGDAAEICFIELVDFNETMLKEKAGKATRRRRTKKKKSETEETVAESKPTTEAKEESKPETDNQ
jgi:large subunit ribosomal protein L17